MARFYFNLLPASSRTSRDCTAAIADRSRDAELRLRLGVRLRSVVTNLEDRALGGDPARLIESELASLGLRAWEEMRFPASAFARLEEALARLPELSRASL